MLSKSRQWVRTHWLLLAAVVLLVLVVVWWLPGLFVHDLSDSELKKILDFRCGTPPADVRCGTPPAEVAKAKTDRLNARNNVRMGLLQGLGGGALLVGVFLTARQIGTTREGQVTDRYTKAIDQLDEEKSVDVHIGGIYALERIARDSERDGETIVQVLLAYVREHLPRTPEMKDEETLRVRADVEAAMLVLGRPPCQAGLRLNHLDLSRASLSWAYLSRAKANNDTTWPEDFGETTEERREAARARGVKFEESDSHEGL